MDYKQTEEELGKEIGEQYKLSKNYLDPIHGRFNDQEELYRSYINPTDYPNKARVFDPRVFRVVETVTPRMVDNEPTGSFYPQEEGDMGVAHILNSLIKYDWRRADMFPKLVNFVKSMLIFGTAFGRCYWDFREEDRARMKPKMINGRMVWTPTNKEVVKVTAFDGPNFEVLNIYDCFPDPNATNMDNMRWFIYRRFKTIEELEAENDTRGGDYYKNLDKLKQLLNVTEEQKQGAVSQPEDLNFREHRRIMLSTQEYLGKDTSNPDLVILRRFTKSGWCDYVPEYNLIIREIDNPYFHGQIPIVYGVDYPYPGDLFGMGEIEPIERIQRAINAVLNQRLDNVQLTLNTMWKVKKAAGVDMHTLISKPGNIITATDIDGVQQVQTPDVTGGTFVQTMNYLTSSLQNGSGITDYTVGLGNNANVGNKTATGTRLIQQEANAQFKLKLQLFNHMVVQPIANQWKDLRVQYTTEAQTLRIIGSEAIEYLKKNTKLATTSMEGEEIFPGDDTAGKLDIKSSDFAFLKLLPEDIQPSVVGNYDFIAQVSSDQLNDPIALQENFFGALDRMTTPVWTQGLAQQKKMLNFDEASKKIFDKLQMGLEGDSLITDLPAPPQQPQMGQNGQPIPQQELNPQQELEQEVMGEGIPPELQQEVEQVTNPEPGEGDINGL